VGVVVDIRTSGFGRGKCLAICGIDNPIGCEEIALRGQVPVDLIRISHRVIPG
jgi:hypothetical protein